MNVIIEEIKIHQENRGFVFEPLRKEDIPAQNNIHVVITLPGFIRGNHYHKKGTEIVVVYGAALIRIKEKEEIKDIIVPENKPLRITIPPGISHAIKNIGSKSNILIACNTLEHDPQNPDVFPDILIDKNNPSLKAHAIQSGRHKVRKEKNK